MSTVIIFVNPPTARADSYRDWVDQLIWRMEKFQEEYPQIKFRQTVSGREGPAFMFDNHVMKMLFDLSWPHKKFKYITL